MNRPLTPQRRIAWSAVVEAAVLVTAVTMGFVTYGVLKASTEPERLLSPGLAALLLLANLIPVVALLVLIGRRVAKHRAARAQVAGDGRLHVRLVATFSVIASVPIILTVIAASVMFQSVNQFWVSSRAEKAFDSTIGLVQDARDLVITRWIREGVT
ncbi:MAG: PAS domain-containing sensor histidine kinase, partial [Sphingomonas sp.]